MAYTVLSVQTLTADQNPAKIELPSKYMDTNGNSFDLAPGQDLVFIFEQDAAVTQDVFLTSSEANSATRPDKSRKISATKLVADEYPSGPWNRSGGMRYLWAAAPQTVTVCVVLL